MSPEGCTTNETYSINNVIWNQHRDFDINMFNVSVFTFSHNWRSQTKSKFTSKGPFTAIQRKSVLVSLTLYRIISQSRKMEKKNKIEIFSWDTDMSKFIKLKVWVC